MDFSRHAMLALVGGVSIAVAAPAQAQVRTFSIPAGSLKAALDAYARQSGKQVIYRVDDVRSARSSGARGRLTAEDALTALLAGSGFASRADASGAIAIVRSEEGNARPLGVAEPEPPSAGSADQNQAGSSIVVTGSRIRRPNLESVVPITSVSGEEFFQTGQVAIGEVLNELPALRSTITQTNSFRTTSPGINMLDLRGLGIDRTLVLQNGRRHVPGHPFNTAVDVNTMPTDLIERVDIVTGGSSAIYGSDAIAGVVNFVLKRDYEGMHIRGQGGISKYGDAGQYYVSALAGTNFADGRGNVAVNVEYARQDDVYFSQRARLRQLDLYLQVDADPPGTPNGSDGVPDRVLLRDVRQGIFNLGGSFGVSQPGPDGFRPNYFFRPDGRLELQTGERVPLLGLYLGGNGSTGREGRQFGLVPRLDRYSVNLLGHFTFSDAFEPFVEAKFVRSDGLGSTLGPYVTFSGRFSDRELYRTDNPFLHPEARTFIRQTLGLQDGEEAEFFFSRTLLDLGTRQEDIKRDTSRLVAGVRGDLDDDWHYEMSVNVSQVKALSRNLNDLDIQRFVLALDAVRHPQTGQIVCRSQIDPSAALPYDFSADPAFSQARLARDVAECIPLNPFGEGNISQAARDYVNVVTSSQSKINQTVLNAFVTGDSSNWFELPGGPVGIALGAEYRRETYRDVQDELLQADQSTLPRAPLFEPPTFEVKELFGELRIPLLANRPMFEELTISAAARVADYKDRTGTVVAWNAGAEWVPVRDLRFRANWSRAVRAPNVSETNPDERQAFVPGSTTDPCSAEAIGSGSSNRATNCRAAGVPAGFQFLYQGGFQHRLGGNPLLREEESDSLTIGGIFQPRWLPGFSLSIDYYDIKVSDVIASPGVQQILNSCYDGPSLDNGFCELFQRHLGPGLGPNGEIPGQIIVNSLLRAPVNFAGLKVRGIDAEAAYRRRIEGIGELATRLVYTLALQNDSFLNPQDPDFANQNLLELGNPRHAFNWNVDIKRGPFTFGYQMRYFSKTAPGAIENIRSVQGRPPQDEDAFEIRYHPDAFYHDLRLALDVGKQFNFYLGVDNVTNRLPPLGVTGIVDDGGIYSNIGRYFYAGAVARF